MGFELKVGCCLVIDIKFLSSSTSAGLFAFCDLDIGDFRDMVKARPL